MQHTTSKPWAWALLDVSCSLKLLWSRDSYELSTVQSCTGGCIFENFTHLMKLCPVYRNSLQQQWKLKELSLKEPKQKYFQSVRGGSSLEAKHYEIATYPCDTFNESLLKCRDLVNKIQIGSANRTDIDILVFLFCDNLCKVGKKYL